jgi:hypothetical protein
MPGRDKFDEHLGRRQPLAVVLLQGAEAVAVNVQAGHVGDGKGPKEGQPVTEGGTDDNVHILRCGHTLLDQAERFLQQHILQPVQHKASLVPNPSG